MSIPRERALAYVLKKECPGYLTKHIHESSPSDRGISKKLRESCPGYISSQYYPYSPEKKIDKHLNINLEQQDFSNEEFDIFISLDVMEHVFDPKQVIKEIYRTLKSGGVAIMTFPISNSEAEAWKPRSVMKNGQVEHLLDPQFHGNPIDPNGSLVTIDYGYNIHKAIANFAPFNVEIIRFDRRDIGVVGEFTEVVVCFK
jgi:SAM-dependent methyltransferase